MTSGLLRPYCGETITTPRREWPMNTISFRNSACRIIVIFDFEVLLFPPISYLECPLEYSWISVGKGLCYSTLLYPVKSHHPRCMVWAICIAGRWRGKCSKQEEGGRRGCTVCRGKETLYRCTFNHERSKYPSLCETHGNHHGTPCKPLFYHFPYFSCAFFSLCPFVHLDPFCYFTLPHLVTLSSWDESIPPWAPSRFDVTQHGSLERGRQLSREVLLHCTILLFLPHVFIITVTHLSWGSPFPYISFITFSKIYLSYFVPPFRKTSLATSLLCLIFLFWALPFNDFSLFTAASQHFSILAPHLVVSLIFS